MLEIGLEKMLRQKEEDFSGRDPLKEAEKWHESMSALDNKRKGYQAMAAEGLINFVELKERLQELEEVQAATQREIDSLLHKGGQLEEMCRNKEALLERLKDIPVRQIDSLYPDERRRIYQIVGLRAITKEDGTVEVAGDLTDLCFGNLDPTLSISVLTLPGQTAFTRTPRPPTRRPGCASAL